MKSTGKNITPLARWFWKKAFNGESWPKGWKVQYVGFMRGAAGLCDYGTRRILISRADHRPKKERIAVQVVYKECGMTIQEHVGFALASDQHRSGMDILHTLLHEFIHVRCRGLRHGKEFERLIAAAYARVWEHQ